MIMNQTYEYDYEYTLAEIVLRKDAKSKRRTRDAELSGIR